MNFGNRNSFLLFSALLFLTIAIVSLSYKQSQFSTSKPSSEPAEKVICNIDADCVVKNVGNCCGYYPRCVNKDYQPNPEAVQKRCEELKVASICGFPEIESCECQKGQCVNIPNINW